MQRESQCNRILDQKLMKKPSWFSFWMVAIVISNILFSFSCKETSPHPGALAVTGKSPTLAQLSENLVSNNRNAKNAIAETYLRALQSAIQTRDSLGKRYKESKGTGKDSIVTRAQSYLFDLITTRFFDCWYGTPWDFYGTTRTPSKGSIACGYFVTTILSDAGLNIPRVKWAESASEVFIVKLSNDLKRFRNQPIDSVVKYIKGRPNGLYIVGLDCHVGFIMKNGEAVKFVHSSYYHPEIGVMAEELDSKNPLSDSQYRVIGRILDTAMVKKWLLNEKYQ
jgi:hypothetical protein